jgi:hypothetical protein
MDALENIEVLVDEDGTIRTVIRCAEEDGLDPLVIECVEPDDAFAPQE